MASALDFHSSAAADDEAYPVHYTVNAYMHIIFSVCDPVVGILKPIP